MCIPLKLLSTKPFCISQAKLDSSLPAAASWPLAIFGIIVYFLKSVLLSTQVSVFYRCCSGWLDAGSSSSPHPPVPCWLHKYKSLLSSILLPYLSLGKFICISKLKHHCSGNDSQVYFGLVSFCPKLKFHAVPLAFTHSWWAVILSWPWMSCFLLTKSCPFAALSFFLSWPGAHICY